MADQRPFTGGAGVAPAGPTFAVDVSNYTGPLSDAQLAVWKRDGVGLVIVQSIDPPPGYPPGCTVEQILAAQHAGLNVEAYVFLWFGLGVPDIQAKLDLLYALGIERVWLDVEDTSARSLRLSKRISTVAAALATISAAGYETGIYTGYWFWTGYMGNTNVFSSANLWDAHYDGEPDPAADFVPYGGWSNCLIKQYAGTSTLDGVGNVDLDEERA